MKALFMDDNNSKKWKEVIWCKEQGDTTLPSYKNLSIDNPDPMKSIIINYLKQKNYRDDEYFWWPDLIDAVQFYNVKLPEDFRNHIIKNYQRYNNRCKYLKHIDKFVLEFSLENQNQQFIEIKKNGMIRYRMDDKSEEKIIKSKSCIFETLKDEAEEILIYQEEANNREYRYPHEFSWKFSVHSVKDIWLEITGEMEEESWITVILKNMLSIIENETKMSFGVRYLQKQLYFIQAIERCESCEEADKIQDEIEKFYHDYHIPENEDILFKSGMCECLAMLAGRSLIDL